MKIGVFDSGIGGVTVLREILQVLPQAEYLYYSDSANNPYGDRSAEEICELSVRACEYLLAAGCQAIVVACNTASANAADALRARFPEVPIVAIEPAYKMVHDLAPDEPALVLATRGTLRSEKFHRLYTKYDNDRTELVDCSGLAELIENEDERLMDFLWVRIGSYREQVKNVVLGCTHYPLAAEEIAEVLGGEVQMFDGAPAVAKHLKEVLSERGMTEECEQKVEFYDTSGRPEKAERFWEILGL